MTEKSHLDMKKKQRKYKHVDVGENKNKPHKIESPTSSIADDIRSQSTIKTEEAVISDNLIEA
jgi:hypothetical protein